MGMDISSKPSASAAMLNRVTQAQTQAQTQVAQAIESKDPAAIASAMTQATSKVGQALQADSFQPASKAQAAWSASYASGAPSLTGSAPVPQATASAPTSATASNPMNFTPQQLSEIGAKVGAATQGAAATASNPMGFTAKQLYDIGTKVGNSIAESQDVASNSESKNGFDNKSNVVAQSTDTNCAAAAVATLSTDKTDKPAKSGQEIEQHLTDTYSGPQGTTPKQVTEMLANQGLKVTASYTKLDSNALNASLKTGDKAIAMVDSNAINPKTQGDGPGKAHWVTIDGMDKSGNYQVKDPASGRSYYVSPEQLDKAMGTVRGSTNTGGMFTVSAATGNASQDQLTQQSDGDAVKLGNAPGTGSRRDAFASESS